MKQKWLRIWKNIISLVLSASFFSFMPASKTAEAADSNLIFGIDFSDDNSIANIKVSTAYGQYKATNQINQVTDDGYTALAWSQKERQRNQYSNQRMDIDFASEIEAKYPIIVEYSAKLAEGATHTYVHSLKGKTANGANVILQYGIYKWCCAGNTTGTQPLFRVRNFTDVNGTKHSFDKPAAIIKYRGEVLNFNKYYVHRYIINADGTYDFYIKEDEKGAEWEQLFAEGTLSVTYRTKDPDNGETLIENEMPKVLTGLYNEAGYFTGNANTPPPDGALEAETINYYKYVNIYKQTDNILTQDAVYVSPNGNDSANGTYSEPMSLQAAVEYVKDIKRISPMTNTTIYFKGGEYYLSDTIYIDLGMSGLTLVACEGETVNVYGQYKIDNSMIFDADASDCDGRLPKELIGKIKKIDLSTMPEGQLNFQDDFEDREVRNDALMDVIDKNENPYHNELIDSKKAQTLARWPDNDWAYMGEITNIEYETVGGSTKGKAATFATSNALNWNTFATDIRIMNFRHREYEAISGRISDINKKNNTVKINQYSSGLFEAQSRYFFYNIPEEISMPGEYYIDYENKVAYYYPENAGNMNLGISTLPDGILRIKNAKNITIKGINFVGTQGTAIYAQNSDNIDVIGCDFSYTGDCGIMFKNCENCDLTTNNFDNIGNTSLYIEGGDRPSLTSSNNKVTDSVFTNGARLGLTYEPFVQANGIGVQVAHNYFYNHKSHAIHFNGNDMIIEYNVINNCANDTRDTGAVYSGRNSTWWGNVIRNNIFKNIRTGFADERYGDVHAIYLDDILPGTTVNDNLFYNCSNAINVGGGICTTVTGNLIYDCYHAGNYGWRDTIDIWQVQNSSGSHKWIKELQNSKGYDETKWNATYPGYAQLVYDLENPKYIKLTKDKISAATDSEIGDAGYTVLESTLVKGATVKDNMLVSTNLVENDNMLSSQRTLFTMDDKIRNPIDGVWTIWRDGKYATFDIKDEISYAEGYQGAFGQNYFSSDINHVSLNENREIKINYSGTYRKDERGNGILASEYSGGGNFSQNTFNVPDIKTAGPITLDVSYLEDSDNYRDGKYVATKDRVDYSASATKYLVEDFKDEIESAFVRNGGQIKNDGLYLSGTAIFTPKESVCGKVHITIDLTDTANVIITDSNGVSSEHQTIAGNNEFTIEDGIKDIKISGNGVYVKYLAVNSEGNTILRPAYYLGGYEDAVTKTSVQEYDKRLFTYNRDTGAAQNFVEEADGNKAIQLGQKNSAETKVYLEVFNEPVKTAGKTLVFESAIKSQQDEQGLLEAISAYGFSSNKNERLVEAFAVKQDTQTKNLFYNGTEIATKDELISDYVRLRVTVANDVVQIYKKNQNGVYELKATNTSANIPEYIDRVQFSLYNYDKIADNYSYLIDDIAIYEEKALMLKSQNGDIIYPGDRISGNLRISPAYIPGTNIKTVIAAVYDSFEKLKFVQIADYKPDAVLDVIVPNDDGDYFIKYFTWKDIGNLVPVNKSIEFKY